ncbi:hypothetical protein N9251_01430 [Gammaproteobacteria bacterium]|nr:hypothetical protein [Gammaproteobacteria bacterium]
MRNLILLLVSCGIFLLLGEAAVRVVFPEIGSSGFPPYSPELLVPNERRSYNYQPGYEGIAGGKNGVYLSINNLGMRDADVVPGELISVLAVGDSFTAGYMVSEAEAWPAMLEHFLTTGSGSENSIRVLNGGVSGYNIRQIRYAAEDYLPLKPDIVVVGAYPNAANRLFSPYVYYEGYSVRQHTVGFLKMTDKGFLKAINVPRVSASAQFWLMENFKLGALLWLQLARFLEEPFRAPEYASVEDEFAEYVGELSQLKMATDAMGAYLVVMLVAHQEPTGEFSERLKEYNRLIGEYCMANGIRVYDPTSIFEEYPSEGPMFRAGGFDYHWSSLAHSLAARGLADMLMEPLYKQSQHLKSESPALP